MTPGPGIEPGSHWWEASALTTAPSLLPAEVYVTRTRFILTELHAGPGGTTFHNGYKKCEEKN